VIGGTGPTGPLVVEGLHERGFDVTIMHGGQHEVEFAVSGVRHIHADPHFRETLEGGLGSLTFDLVVSQYGRLRVIAEILRDRTDRLIAIGSATGIYAPSDDERWGPLGRPALVPESASIYVRDVDQGRLGFRMVEAMQALFRVHPAATYIGYPVNYGPRQPGPPDWSVVRRILDGRRQMVIADGGIKLESRVSTENAARGVLMVVDQPRVTAGKRYVVSDEHVHSMRQRIEFIARHMGRELELVDMPYPLAWPCHALWRHDRDHRVCDSTLIREELGYTDLVPQDVAMAGSIDWLVNHPLVPGGELEMQLGDPFDYRAEDDLIGRWTAARDALASMVIPSTRARHVYRHPKTPGEQWREP
jgi:nucleoside-diphosphate-sugar epimerase